MQGRPNSALVRKRRATIRHSANGRSSAFSMVLPRKLAAHRNPQKLTKAARLRLQRATHCRKSYAKPTPTGNSHDLGLKNRLKTRGKAGSPCGLPSIRGFRCTADFRGSKQIFRVVIGGNFAAWGEWRPLQISKRRHNIWWLCKMGTFGKRRMIFSGGVKFGRGLVLFGVTDFAYLLKTTRPR